MKSKSKKKTKAIKIKDINPTTIEQELKPIDEHGYPIKRSKVCHFCEQKFVLTFSFSQQNYSRKHSLFFWTEQEKDRDRYTCSSCARSLYLNPKNRKQLSLKKKRHLSSYISQNII